MENEVVMYIIPFCPHCARAKRFLSEKGIKYTEKNIVFSKARQEMKEKTDIMTVPVTTVKDKVLVGFSRAEYEDAFKDF